MMRMRTLVTALLIVLVALAASTPGRANGLSITKVGTYKDDTIDDPRFDGVVCRFNWNQFQPTSGNDAVTSDVEPCIAAAAATGKVAIVQLNFMPSDIAVNQTTTPAWAITAGARVVQDVNKTNIFPVWWDTTYKSLAKAAITKLLSIYDPDPRVAGYHSTGYSGVLPTSLAGEQTAALCDNYRAEGLTTGDCDTNAQSQTIASGSPYGAVVREMLTFWAQSTTKIVVYNTRTLDPYSLAKELEVDPVGLYTNIAVIDNGFRSCDGLLTGSIPRFQGLQAAGHHVGFWSIAVHGFPEDANGKILAGALADAIRCMAENLDMQKVWFALAANTWQDNDDAVDAMYYALRPEELPPPPSPPSGVKVQ
jgi:hypothetical protein